jgi:hypothetical protein
MGSRSAAGSLHLPVQLRGIQLGRPTDILLDLDAWNVLGFAVLCGDESRRFLPYAAAVVSDDEIAVGSALMLLDDAGFYERRGTSFRSLLGTELEGGTLRDLTLDATGHVTGLEIERDGVVVSVPVPARAAA